MALSKIQTGLITDGIITENQLASTLDISGKTVTYGLTGSDLPSGSILTVAASQFQTRTSLGNTYRNATQVTALAPSITRKQPNSSNIWVHLSLNIGVPANHWRAGIKYAYVSDFSTSSNLFYGTPLGHGLTWTSDQFYQYPFLSPLLNDSADVNTYSTVSGSVILTPSSGQNTVWFRVYVWCENGSDTTMINGTQQNNVTHGSVSGSSLTLMEIAA